FAILDVQAVAQEAGGSGVAGTRFAVVEAAEFERAADAHGHAQRFDGEFARAGNLCASPDEHSPPWRVGTFTLCARDTLARGEQHFVEARGERFGDDAPERGRRFETSVGAEPRRRDRFAHVATAPTTP